jgi:hypothetical protein
MELSDYAAFVANALAQLFFSPRRFDEKVSEALFIDEPVAGLLCCGDLAAPRKARHVVLRTAGDLRGRSGGDEVAAIDSFALDGDRGGLQLCFSNLRQQSLPAVMAAPIVGENSIGIRLAWRRLLFEHLAASPTG